MSTSTHGWIGAAAIVILAVPQTVLGQTTQPQGRAFTFDHYLQKDGGTILTELAPDEPFRIVLAHTCESDFEYSVYTSPAVRTTSVLSVRAAGDVAPHATTTVTKGPIEHSAKWGSYILQVTPKSGSAHKCDVYVDKNGVPVQPPDAALKNRDAAPAPDGGHWEKDVEFKGGNYIVAVSTQTWEIGADAVLAYTHGSDQKYMTVQAPAPNANKLQVVRDSDGEAPGRIAFGTLTHFYLPGRKVPNGPALGFSVLASENNQTEYYFGWGFGLAPKQANRLNLALGAAYTPVSMLPKGVTLDSLVDNASAIEPVRNVYRWRFFFGVTATLFKTGDDGGKPPAPNPPTTTP